VADTLDRAAAVLADTDRQRRDARGRDRPDHGPEQHEDPEADSEDHSDENAHEMSGMDHGDMDMAPGGIPLAGGGDDRDGLEMDVLQVPLGPVLPCWPAGLILRCSLQGDVVVAAEVEVLPAGSAAPAPDLSPRAAAARQCDRASQVLELSGWGTAAQQAARVRDDLLTGSDAGACLALLARLRTTVQRSRLLRWSLRDLGRTDAASTEGPSVRPVGDVHDRLLSFLRSAGDLLDERVDERVDEQPDQQPGGRPSAVPRGTVTPLHELPDLVTGLDLAAVRLVVASVAPDTATTDTSATVAVSGG